MTHLVSEVHTGDSIAGNNGLPGYFFQAWSLTGRGDQTSAETQSFYTYSPNANLLLRNSAVAGSRLQPAIPTSIDLVVVCPIWVDPLIPVGYVVPPFDRTRRYIFTTAIGSNDGGIGEYGTGNYAQYAAAVAACCVLRKTAGYNLVGICTLLPRTDGAMDESNRLGYNSTIKNSSWQAAHGIDFVIDLASQAIMGDPASCANATYYSDLVHPTAVGHGLLAPIFLAGINAAIAML